MTTIADIVKSIRPDLPAEISEQIGSMVESLTNNQVDPSLSVFNITLLSKIYDENPGIEFKVGKCAKMRNTTVPFIIDFDVNEAAMLTDVPSMIENHLINDCLGTVNIDIDGLPSDKKITFWSETPVHSIWKTPYERKESGEIVPEKVHVALSYGLTFE